MLNWSVDEKETALVNSKSNHIDFLTFAVIERVDRRNAFDRSIVKYSVTEKHKMS